MGNTQTESTKRSSHKRVAKGQCSRCTQEINFTRSKTMCTFHLDYSRSKYKKKMPNGLKRNKIETCRLCSNPTAPDKLVYCKKHSHADDLYETQMIRIKYKLSREEYEELLKITRCQICDSEEKLHIDHDHTTGKVRGRLCNTCNLRLGNQVENGWYLKAVSYLTNS